MEVTSPISGQATLSPDDAKMFEAGDMYINVHTKNHPDGGDPRARWCRRRATDATTEAAP